MTELLTAAQMRAVEAAAIASGQVTGLDLMERAGRGVVEAVFAEWPNLAATSPRAVVLCGPGNNGGDGFVVARLLKEWGWEVEVFLYGDPERMPPDARVNYERWCGMGEVRPVTDQPGKPADLIVDALFGIGLSRPVDLDPNSFLGRFDPETGHRNRRLVAIDVPSGLCSDSGKVLGDFACSADLTVTFHAAKTGQYLNDGPVQCGIVQVVDIGLTAPDRVDGRQARSQAPIVELTRIRRRLQKAGHHKYHYGHAVILSGPTGKTGAARLSARGALRVGAGLVTLGCPADALAECAAQLTAIMLTTIPDGSALTTALKDARINALCLGPGLGLDRADLVAAALGTQLVAVSGSPPAPDAPRAGQRLWSSRVKQATSYRPTVLDADALTILSRNPDLVAALHSACVLTPHAGEFGRLFPDIAEKLNASATSGPAYSKVDATRDAAKRAGCVVLFKGPDTVIADPSGRCSINSANYDRSAPWLATAGSGDVLAGFITGLLARGYPPMQAAETAAWLHVECARSFGPGLIAEDLPEELPQVFKALGL